MSIAYSCPMCETTKSTLVYTAKHIPIFQNRVYATKELAMNVPVSNMDLVKCNHCDFVFNAAFDQSILLFDKNYENEQSNSSQFQNHLSSVVDLFNQHSFQNKNIIEIGCGEGFFLEKLNQLGFKIAGFDPAYTGTNSNIIKDYFRSKYHNLSAEVIILRHVLAHIKQPLDFLHTIAKSVNYDAKIYMEVSSLDWIIEHTAFWDLYYEHCNYFTHESFAAYFNKSQSGLLFNGQYLYLIADLKDLKTKDQYLASAKKHPLNFNNFNETINRYRKNLEGKKDIALWGAGAKGVTFANLIDPNLEMISCLIDINPKKQNQYIAKTAHKIISPTELKEFALKDILVMNGNYFNEIQSFTSSLGINVMTLEMLN